MKTGICISGPAWRRAEPQGDPCREEQRGDVGEQSQAVHPGQVHPAAGHLHAAEQGDPGDHDPGDPEPGGGTDRVAEHDRAAPAGRQHHPAAHPLFEVTGDREPGEHPGQRRGLDQDEAELESGEVVVAEARGVADR